MRFAISAALTSLVVAFVGGLVATMTLLRPRRRAGRVAAPAQGKGAVGVVQEPARAAARPATQLVCTTCGRSYQSGLHFCPHDATPLQQVGTAAVLAAGGVSCPVCHRHFDVRVKFCPFDAEELVAKLPAYMIGAAAADRSSLGRICPSCAQRYASDATYCGRDGAELVSVN